MTSARFGSIAMLEDASAIEEVLRDFLQKILNGTADLPAEPAVEAAARTHRTEELVGLFERILGTTTKAEPQ